MPPVTKSQKKELLKKVQKAFNVIGKEYTDEEKERILADPERDRIHELGEKYANYRNDCADFVRDNYPEIKYTKFKRLVPLYMDMSGTPEADAKNRELLTSLSTEEGCEKFAKRAAGDILRTDIGFLQPYDDFGKNVEKYASHARELEICWAALDLKNEAKPYLDKAVYDLIEERLPMYQAAGAFAHYATAAANDLYTVMPELTAEEIEKISLADDEDDPKGMYKQVDDEDFVAEFYRYKHCYEVIDINAHDVMSDVMKKASEMEEDGELTPHTIAKNDKGERVRLSDGIASSLKGEKITFEENVADKPIVSSYVNEALKPIRMPKKGSALYDTFSDEALSAQGKGFQTECTRLAGIMDGAKLWYTGGSPEFREITRLLKETASGDVPNKDEALEKMNRILALCDKYAENKRGLQLKEREQKRLDAVNAVRDSLYPKKNFLSGVKIKGDAMRFEAANGLGDKGQAFHTSTENQKYYHTAESERKAALYRKELDSYKGADGALGRLAESVDKTVTMLADYSVSEKAAGERPKFIADGSLPKAIAEMALLEYVRSERAQAQKHGLTDIKGDTEKMLDKLAERDPAWHKAVDKVAATETVRKLTEDIAESPAGAAEYFVQNGPKKLLGDLKKELLGLAPEEKKDAVKDNDKKIDAPAKKVPSKTEPQMML